MSVPSANTRANGKVRSCRHTRFTHAEDDDIASPKALKGVMTSCRFLSASGVAGFPRAGSEHTRNVLRRPRTQEGLLSDATGRRGGQSGRHAASVRCGERQETLRHNGKYRRLHARDLNLHRWRIAAVVPQSSSRNGFCDVAACCPFLAFSKQQTTAMPSKLRHKAKSKFG
jgi:hypothetical protein